MTVSIRTLTLAALGLAFTVAPASALAAKPKAKIYAHNKDSMKITVAVYNGNDASCAFPLKTYDVNSGEKKTLRCHGKGKSRCRVKSWQTNKSHLYAIHDCMNVTKGSTFDPSDSYHSPSCDGSRTGN